MLTIGLPNSFGSLDEEWRVVADLDGLPPIGDLRQAKVNALPAHAFGWLQVKGGEELSLRDAAQSALMASVLDKAFKGKL